MANLRDIINAATPGPWEVDQPFGGMADVVATIDGRDFVAFDDRYGACRLADAHHIAAYSPDHARLIEDVVSAALAYIDGRPFSVFALANACARLEYYRKERGLDG